MLLSLLLSAFLSLPAQADGSFQLRDVGVIGLMSHDVFAWDHKREVNTENGRLDLSTIFDFDGGKRWREGGNTKNSENAPVYTITMQLVRFYEDQLRNGADAVSARRETVRHFHSILRETYERVRGLPFPAEAIDAIPDNTEQAALRGLHDILPGRVALYDRSFQKELRLTDFLRAKTLLNEKELSQPLRPFDGDYDAEYRKIQIPFSPVVLDLKEIDRKFIEKFSDLKQAEMLAALKEVGEGRRSISDVYFIPHVDALFTKALCPNGNTWMPAYPCR